MIISLEVHAGAAQQEIMVEIIKSTFKGHLVNPPPTHSEPSLPSPAALRKKILIKVKYVDSHKAASKTAATAVAKNRPALEHTSSASSNGAGEQEISPAGHTSSDHQKEGKKKPSAIIPALSDLGVYTRSYHFSSLSSPNALIPEHVFSLSEKKLMELHESSGPTLFSHNRNFLMRAFPSGMRVRSDNLDPSVFWRKGVQMVALNWQRWDEGMMLNEGMFTGSGGWVLKPAGYLGQQHRDGKSESKDNDPSHTTDIKSGAEKAIAVPAVAAAAAAAAITADEKKPKIGAESQAAAIAHKTLTLLITIFAVQDLPLPLGEETKNSTRTTTLHPYVKVELHVEKPAERSGAPIDGGGKSKDEAQYKHQTRTAKGTAEVDFGGEVVRFRDVPGVVEELSFVRYVPTTKLPWILVFLFSRRHHCPGFFLVIISFCKETCLACILLLECCVLFARRSSRTLDLPLPRFVAQVLLQWTHR